MPDSELLNTAFELLKQRMYAEVTKGSRQMTIVFNSDDAGRNARKAAEAMMKEGALIPLTGTVPRRYFRLTVKLRNNDEAEMTFRQKVLPGIRSITKF